VKPETTLGAAKPPSAKGDANLRPSRAQVTEPPDADPHVRWCGRGGAVRFPPIPIAKVGRFSLRVLENNQKLTEIRSAERTELVEYLVGLGTELVLELERHLSECRECR
jgi:hypothetical protein